MRHITVAVFLLVFIAGVKGDVENLTEEDSSVELPALPEKGTTLKPANKKSTTNQATTPCPPSAESPTTVPPTTVEPTLPKNQERRSKTKANAVQPTPTPTPEQPTLARRTSLRKPKCKTFKLKSTRGRSNKITSKGRFRKPFENTVAPANQINHRRIFEQSLPTEWFRRTIKQLSEKKLRTVGEQTGKKRKNSLAKRNMQNNHTVAAFQIDPKNHTSESFNQSVRVMKYSHVLMQLSELLKTYAGKTDNQEEVVKQAEDIATIASRKRDSAFALLKKDLPQNMRLLKRAENEATEKLKMLRVLSSGASKRSADVPNESITFDVMKTEENALEVTEKLAEFVATALAKNETVNVAEVVDSALSVF